MGNKNYIIIGAMGGYISGAPIYYRNKALYMKSKGWNVFCISCRAGKVYVGGLEQFIIGTFPILATKAYLFSSFNQEKIIGEIIKCLPILEQDIIIETGTYYTAYWGEILAQKLKARHLVIYLDEHNVGIRKGQSNFFRFKYEREELACISNDAYKDIFSPLFRYVENRAYTVPCYCQNSLEDVVSPVINNVLKTDFTIGYVGRLEKDAFKTLIDNLCLFAKQNSNKIISLNCFGDYGNKKDEDVLRKRLSEFSNIQLYISGFLFPIPKKAIEKCDLCFGSAGSVAVALKANVATIKINVYSNMPEGFKENVIEDSCVVCPNCKTILDYLNVFFIGKYRPKIQDYNLKDETYEMDKCLREHLLFMDHSLFYKQLYFNFLSIRLSFKEKIAKYGIYLLGYDIYQILILLRNKIKRFCICNI